jgi:hypothetical protein
VFIIFSFGRFSNPQLQNIGSSWGNLTIVRGNFYVYANNVLRSASTPSGSTAAFQNLNYIQVRVPSPFFADPFVFSNGHPIVSDRGVGFAICLPPPLPGLVVK